MDMGDAPLPDVGNYDLPEEQPIPDNFLDDTLSKAMTHHSRKESQIQSVQDDFAKVLDENVAQNIAANLIGYIHTDDPNAKSKQTQIDPDEDDVRTGNDDDDDNNNNKQEYSLDEMLIDTVTQHKHRESRTDFVQQKLHEMFPQEEEETNAGDMMMDMMTGGGPTAGYGGGKIDMSQIASNLVAFLHDDTSKPQTPQYPPEEISLQQSQQYEQVVQHQQQQPQQKHKARGSTDLTVLQEEISGLENRVNVLQTALKSKDDKNNELNDRVKELESKNSSLLKEIQFLQNSKTTLAINSTKCIDELRDLLLQYQKKLNLTSD
mmetsp:Transcript_52476/g.47109  ORF Transcript_52476/g.47109 Transcript_52476/m.47109 type:complete len:320 (-) Transcript_52476:282-1241(-)|eukprot:CAMPEP_0201577240 /NCGR_PEP_ID=MMETSP0190_2-20130828/23519_1 /ASSEMBLY_ACC=CAM_ASM_000263 /TAXON_ID=37353 /ORGANISM="Rosalina sp." /LENGTH=319 /DNA_ID=CAMNT_0048009055 /DNA_START=25 /DNA_END=984 /DNA_ORIENTATION=-